MTRLGPDLLRDPERAARVEWLLTDGRGGWSASSALGLDTRREHGLLIAPVGPAETPCLLLARVEETLVLGEHRLDLSTGAYPGTWHPRGFEHLVSFQAAPLPTWQWEMHGVRLTRVVARLHGEPACALVYTLEGAPQARLEVRPMLAYRALDALQVENAAFRTDTLGDGGDLLFDPYGGFPALRWRVPGGTWEAAGYWYRRRELVREREAGRTHHEDLWSPGLTIVTLRAGSPQLALAAATPLPARSDAAALVEREKQRLRALRGGAGDPLGALRRAADAFLVRRADGRIDVVGAYPDARAGWDEALQALPGLALETRRLQEARALLSRLPAELAPEADLGVRPEARLRGVLCVARVVQLGEDGEGARRRLLAWLFGTLAAGLAGRLPGALLHEPTGLLLAPEERGSIDLQALWFNALLAGVELAREARDERRASAWATVAARVRESVLRHYWQPERAYLADAWSPVSGPDRRLRARQIAAVALPHALLPREKAAPLLQLLGAELLTPVGLRTLAPSEADYVGRDDGADTPEAGRGSAWPALACAYFEALMRVSGEEGKRAGRVWLQAFEAQLGQAVMGFVGQRFDGDAPHAPRAPFASAVAVGELLRLTLRLGPLRR